MKSKSFTNSYEKLYLITPKVYETFVDCISEKQRENLEHLNTTNTDPNLENSDNDLFTLDTVLSSEITEPTDVPNSIIENKENMTPSTVLVSADVSDSADTSTQDFREPVTMSTSADAATQLSSELSLPKTIKYVDSSTPMENKKVSTVATQTDWDTKNFMKCAQNIDCKT